MIKLVKEIFYSRYAVLYANKEPSEMSLFNHFTSFCVVFYLVALNIFLVFSLFLNLESFIFENFIILSFAIFYFISYVILFKKIDMNKINNFKDGDYKENMNTFFIAFSVANLIALMFLLETTNLPLVVKIFS